MPSQSRVWKSTFGVDTILTGNEVRPEVLQFAASDFIERRTESISYEFVIAAEHDLGGALIAQINPEPQAPNLAPVATIDLKGAASGTEARLDTSTNAKLEPALAALAGGGYVAVWSSSGQDGSGYGVYAQRFDAGGAAQGAETRVNTYTTSDQWRPAVTALTDGGYVVVWDSRGQDFGDEGVYGQRYGSNGVAQGSEFRVNTNTMQSQKSAAVASLAGGGFVVVWQSAEQDGNADGVYMQRYDAAGARLGGETLVNSYISGFQALPAIVSLASGGYVVAWTSYIQDSGASPGIYTQRFDASGARQGAETRVNSMTADIQRDVAMTALTGGGYVVAWQSFGQDGSEYGIFAQRYDGDGVPQGAETRVNTYTAGSQDSPTVAALTSGGYVVTWQSSLQDGSGYGIYAQRFDAAGVARGPETRINTFTTNSQSQQAIAALADDGYVIAWNSFGQIGSQNTIHAQRFGNLVATEQTTIDLKDRILVSDADAAGGTITVTLSVAQGILGATAGSSGALVSGSGTGTVQISGTLAQIRSLLQTNSSSTVSFNPNLDNPPATIALTVTVNDNGSTGDGGPLSGSATAQIGIVPVNDAPMTYYATRGIVLGNNYTFTTSDFLFYDPEGHGLAAVIISSLPDQGVIRLNGAPIAAGSVINASAIAAGLLTYAPDPGEQGVPYTNFGFQVRDTGGTANGGQDTDLTPAFFTFNVSSYPVYVYGFDSLEGVFPTIQAGLDASGGYNNIEIAGGIYSGSVTFDVPGLIVRFDPSSTVNMTWTPVGALGIDITSGDGSDSIATGAGSDTIRGEGGNDYLSGGGGVDALYGGPGNDSLDGGSGADMMKGGPGDDLYYVDNAGDAVTEAAGQGNDRVLALVSYGLAAGQDVELLSTADDNGTAPINLTGNDLGQLIYGNNGVNVLTGGADADSFLGLGGNDQIFGLGGNDLIDGGAGADRLEGGAGDDIYIIDNASDVIVEGFGGGLDTVYTSIGYLLSDDIERVGVNGFSTTYAINLTGNIRANELWGNDGANVLDGRDGADIMRGQGGNDVYIVDNAGDVVLEGANQGLDTIYTSISLTLEHDIERLGVNGFTTTYAINLTGNELANEMWGNDGVNVIDGKAGADIMRGFGGNDIYFVDDTNDSIVESGLAGGGYDTVYTSIDYTLSDDIERVAVNGATTTFAINLSGNARANEISGNDGANVLNGNGGADILIGNGGADTFVFASSIYAGAVDTILDFQVGLDRIALDDGEFAGLALGALAAGAFRIGSAAQDADDRIIYNSATGALLFDADGNGAGAAVQFASLSNGLNLTASDFLVI